MLPRLIRQGDSDVRSLRPPTVPAANPLARNPDPSPPGFPTGHGHPRRHAWRWPLAIGLIAVITQFPGLDEPWGRDLQGINGAFFSLQARNLLRLDPDTTHLGGVLNTGDLGSDPPVYYLHHPPLLIWILAVLRQLLGGGEWTARLAILASYAGCACLVHSLGRRWFGEPAAIASAAVFLMLPAADAFALHVDFHGPMTMLPALGILHGWQRLRDGRPGAVPLMAMWIVLGVLTDWPVCYLPFWLWLHACWSGSSREIRRILFRLGVLAGAVLGGVLVHIVATEGSLDSWIAQLAHRTFHFRDDQSTAFGPLDWLARQGGHWRTLYSWPVLAATALWIAASLSGALRRRLAIRNPDGVHLLLLFGATDVVLGLQASYVHDVWSIFLWPGISLATAGLAVGALARFNLWVGPAAVASLIFWGRADAPPRHTPAQLDEWAGYSCRELADLIRSESRSDEGVLVLGEYACPPALYYYADRTLAPFVGDRKTLDEAFSGDGYFGPLGFPVPSRRPLGLAVIPVGYESQLPDPGLVVDLRNRAVSQEIRGKFVAYRLRAPISGTAGQVPAGDRALNP